MGTLQKIQAPKKTVVSHICKMDPLPCTSGFPVSTPPWLGEMPLGDCGPTRALSCAALCSGFHGDGRAQSLALQLSWGQVRSSPSHPFRPRKEALEQGTPPGPENCLLGKPTLSLECSQLSRQPFKGKNGVPPIRDQWLFWTSDGTVSVVTGLFFKLLSSSLTGSTA